MIALGDTKIAGLYLGDTKIQRAYLGEYLVYEGIKKPSRLPERYKEVEYIESNGTQCIDTNLKPSLPIKIVMDVEPTSAPDSTDRYFFDSLGSSGTTIYTYRMIWMKSGVFAAMGRYSRQITNTILSSDVTLRRMVLEMDSAAQKVSINGVSKSFSNTMQVISNMNNISLLSFKNYQENAVPAKLYSCQISTGGTLVRDFAPCIDPSGAVGLYDLAGNKFYGNYGTGSFAAGPAV